MHTSCGAWVLGGLVVGLAAVGCKRKEAPPPAPAETASRTTDQRKLAEGERPWVDPAGRDPAVEWKPAADGKPVIIYPVRVEDDTVAVRVQRGDQVQDVERFRLREGGAPKVEIRSLPGGRATVEYGPVADGDSNRYGDRRVLLLVWDEGAAEAKVRKRWRGKDVDRRPAWTRSGEVDLSPTALASCQTVVGKMARCSGDRAYQDALLERVDADVRPGMRKTIGEDGRTWQDRERATAVCKEWAGEGYEASALSDPQELAELEKETNMECEMFARELVDEGGLPRKVTTARTTTAEHR